VADRIKMTVIVPTRERCDTLASTLDSCVAQDYPDLEIIVSDNFSRDDTAAVVKAVGDPRVRYINTGRRLDMAGNWEFALDHAGPGFVTYVGDDDALLPGAVGAAAGLIAEHGVKALAWQKVQYAWPDHIEPALRGMLFVPVQPWLMMVDSRRVLERVRRFRSGYDRLPCIYNSFVDVGMLQGLRAEMGGRFFNCVTPDVFSGIVTALTAERYLFSYRPLSVNGASRHSIGTSSMLVNRDDAPAAEFIAETAGGIHPSLTRCPSIPVLVADAFLQAGKVLPARAGGLAPDMRELFDAMLREAAVGSEEAFALVRDAVLDIGRRNGVEQLARRTVDRGPGIKRDQAVITPGMDASRETLVVDTKELGIKDVREAGRLAASLLGPAGWTLIRQPGSLANLGARIAARLGYEVRWPWL